MESESDINSSFSEGRWTWILFSRFGGGEFSWLFEFLGKNVVVLWFMFDKFTL